MNRVEVDQLIEECEAYWPQGVPEKAHKAWRRMLEPFTVDESFAALEAYAAEGHDWPPGIGKVVARINAGRKVKRGKTETELERVRRQRREASQLVKDGAMTARDFAWYEDTYWSLHDPTDTPNEVKAA
jgi:hypothetical protein